MPSRLSRRRFLQATAAGATGFWTFARAEDKKVAANDKLHVGVVGIAGRGAENIKGLAGVPSCEIVALCDVDEGRKDRGVQKMRAEYPKAEFFQDYRKLLEHSGLDAVLVATPDHTHAVITVAALKAGKHVYSEKPLTHTVYEARVVADTARKMKRVTQMGTQIHAESNYRRVVELVQSGAIGKVAEVHVWCDKSWGGGERPKDTPEVPKTLNYDLWLGPAEYRPYHPAYVPYNWRGWWVFGGGTLADMACHHIDLPFWALGLRTPTKLWAEGDPTPAHAETPAKGLVVHYEFPARGEQPAVKLTWYDGGKRPPHFKEGKVPRWGTQGTLFIGEKGMLIADYTKRKLLPEKDFADFTPPKKSIPDSVGHHREWVEACKSGGPTSCNFDYGGALTEAVLLGNVAYRSGKAITWDAAKLKTGSAEADKFLHKEYRKGWSLE
jgi:predicted dehydrogenase